MRAANPLRALVYSVVMRSGERPASRIALACWAFICWPRFFARWVRRLSWPSVTMSGSVFITTTWLSYFLRSTSGAGGPPSEPDPSGAAPDGMAVTNARESAVSRTTSFRLRGVLILPLLLPRFSRDRPPRTPRAGPDTTRRIARAFDEIEETRYRKRGVIPRPEGPSALTTPPVPVGNLAPCHTSTTSTKAIGPTAVWWAGRA